jgi:hypothetical protein
MRKEIEDIGITSETIVDPDSGKLRFRYFQNGRELPYITVTGDHIKRIEGWWLLEHDLQNALSWFQTAMELNAPYRRANHLEHYLTVDRTLGDKMKAFFIASVAFYGKAFAKADGRRAKLNRDDIEGAFRASHDEFIGFRNNVVAHSGATGIEGSQTSLVYLVRETDVSFGLSVDGVQPDFCEHSVDGVCFADLISHAMGKASERRKKLIGDFDDKINKFLDHQWLVEWARRPQPINIDFLYPPKRHPN